MTRSHWAPVVEVVWGVWPQITRTFRGAVAIKVSVPLESGYFFSVIPEAVETF